MWLALSLSVYRFTHGGYIQVLVCIKEYKKDLGFCNALIAFGLLVAFTKSTSTAVSILRRFSRTSGLTFQLLQVPYWLLGEISVSCFTVFGGVRFC